MEPFCPPQWTKDPSVDDGRQWHPIGLLRRSFWDEGKTGQGAYGFVVSSAQDRPWDSDSGVLAESRPSIWQDGMENACYTWVICRGGPPWGQNQGLVTLAFWSMGI